MPDDEELPTQGHMVISEHINELARRLKIVIYTLLVSTVAVMVLPANPSFLNDPLNYYEPLVAVILRIVRQQILPSDVQLIGLTISAPIELYVVASFILALIVTAPVFAYEMYKFINPALYPNERKDIYPFLASFSILFIVGLTFGYLVLAPILIKATFPFFTAVGAELVISITDFYTIVFITTVLTGLTFTFPVFLVLLVKYGVIGTDIIRKNRKYVYFAWFVITAVITPDGGPIADLILFIPTILLMEAGVQFARRYEKGDKKRRISWFEEQPKCEFCDAEMSPGSVFCPRCGKSQK